MIAAKFSDFFRRLFFYSVLLCLSAGFAARGQVRLTAKDAGRLNPGPQAQNAGNRESLLDELRALYDISGLPAYRIHTQSGQVSSYDTTGGNNDGFNGNYSFARRNPDSTLVLLDLEGSGVINRIWTPTPTDDTLDLFIDDTLRPAMSVRYRDLFSGKVYPFIAPLCGSALGGNYCYFPILFQQRCRIVARAKKMQFHQIQYRLFEKGTRVQSFSPLLNEAEKNALEKIGSFWVKNDRTIHDFVPDSAGLKMVSAAVVLAPGQSRTLFGLAQGGRIAGIEFSPADALEGISKNIDLLIRGGSNGRDRARVGLGLIGRDRTPVRQIGEAAEGCWYNQFVIN